MIPVNTAFWDKIMQRAIMRPSVLAASLEELIGEYDKLTPHQWQKRRHLEQSIALRAIDEYRWKKLNKNNNPL